VLLATARRHILGHLNLGLGRQPRHARSQRLQRIATALRTAQQLPQHAPAPAERKLEEAAQPQQAAHAPTVEHSQRQQAPPSMSMTPMHRAPSPYFENEDEVSASEKMADINDWMDEADRLKLQRTPEDEAMLGMLMQVEAVKSITDNRDEPLHPLANVLLNNRPFPVYPELSVEAKQQQAFAEHEQRERQLQQQHEREVQVAMQLQLSPFALELAGLSSVHLIARFCGMSEQDARLMTASQTVAALQVGFAMYDDEARETAHVEQFAGVTRTELGKATDRMVRDRLREEIETLTSFQQW
jgi:hypothetical protein